MCLLKEGVSLHDIFGDINLTTEEDPGDLLQ